MGGRYDKFTNQISKIVFTKFKHIYDSNKNKGKFDISVGSYKENILSNEFEFDLIGVVEITDDEYMVDGGANAGFDSQDDEVTPLITIKFKIPKNPDWQEVSMDIKDVVRHELEHLTQEGLNMKSGKFIEDDQIYRNLMKMGLLPKSDYYLLPKEVDAMLQGLYFKAKKIKLPFIKVVQDYLNKVNLTIEEQEKILNVWGTRAKSLSLPLNINS
jgi:hypothetical protein